jgi:hypothetical protein
MKALKLVSTADNTVVYGTLICDMLSNNPANFTVMEIHDANGKVVDSIPVVTKVRNRLPHSWNTFKADCLAAGVTIKGSDSNGSNPFTV